MQAGWLHGVFVVWRHGSDKETLYDWGVYQTNESGQLYPDAQILNYRPEIVCESRVPIYTSKDPKAILKCDIDAATKVLNDDLISQIRSRADMTRIRDQFARNIRLYGLSGKPKPPVEVVDEHDWKLLWQNATAF